MNKQLYFDFYYDVIPPCSDQLLQIFGSSENVAESALISARKWLVNHPDKTKFDVVLLYEPAWKDYLLFHL